jgi:hypothetical protein
MIDIGDSIEVIVVRHTGAADKRPDTFNIAGMKIWPNGAVGRYEGLAFKKAVIEFRDGEPLWNLIARANGEVKP